MLRTGSRNHFGVGPRYHVGVWLVIYGLLFAAPSFAIAALTWLGSAAGLLTPTGEMYTVVIVALVSGSVVLFGWGLVRAERRDRRRYRELDRQLR